MSNFPYHPISRYALVSFTSGVHKQFLSSLLRSCLPNMWRRVEMTIIVLINFNHPFERALMVAAQPVPQKQRRRLVF